MHEELMYKKRAGFTSSAPNFGAGKRANQDWRPVKPFTIFIPVYNEEYLIVKNTERLIAYLNSLGAPYEVIIGSNGSTDKTIELGEGLQKRYNNLKFFHINETGPGSALRKAVSMASYEHVISVDMDLSVDLNFIKMANVLLTDYDVVVGSKRMGAQKRSFIRKLASAMFIFCAMILLGLSFDDYSLAAKAYRKKCWKGALTGYMGGHSMWWRRSIMPAGITT